MKSLFNRPSFVRQFQIGALILYANWYNSLEWDIFPNDVLVTLCDYPYWIKWGGFMKLKTHHDLIDQITRWLGKWNVQDVGQKSQKIIKFVLIPLLIYLYHVTVPNEAYLLLTFAIRTSDFKNEIVTFWILVWYHNKFSIRLIDILPKRVNIILSK